jgi:hypothetical protein
MIRTVRKGKAAGAEKIFMDHPSPPVYNEALKE